MARADGLIRIGIERIRLARNRIKPRDQLALLSSNAVRTRSKRHLPIFFHRAVTPETVTTGIWLHWIKRVCHASHRIKPGKCECALSTNASKIASHQHLAVCLQHDCIDVGRRRAWDWVECHIEPTDQDQTGDNRCAPCPPTV